MVASLAAAAADFCARLRTDHAFILGRSQTHDVLRAAELIGIDDRTRFKAALRCVCTSRPEEIATFDRAFDDYFTGESPGVPQPEQARRYRPEGNGASDEERQSTFTLEGEGLAERWEAMRARYSPTASASAPPPVFDEGFDDADALAERLVRRIRLGSSRRRRPHPRGDRIDVRRTIRASVQTGGEAAYLRYLARPLRNPRFVVLIDGSRSMNEHAKAALQVAYALCRRTRRASAFVFSTSLREVTRELRRLTPGGSDRVGMLGDAWGGGTRIGASLRDFVRNFRGRIDDHTQVIVVSDGLDVGDLTDLDYAMREISRRAAAVAWVNPHAAEPGFSPTARGMQAVLPYVSTLTTWRGLAGA